jgi:hypothetical protein
VLPELHQHELNQSEVSLSGAGRLIKSETFSTVTHSQEIIGNSIEIL